MKKEKCSSNAQAVVTPDPRSKTKSISKTNWKDKRIKNLEAHLHELILVLESPKPGKKELNQFLNNWFDRTKLLINEH